MIFSCSIVCRSPSPSLSMALRVGHMGMIITDGTRFKSTSCGVLTLQEMLRSSSKGEVRLVLFCMNAQDPTPSHFKTSARAHLRLQSSIAVPYVKAVGFTPLNFISFRTSSARRRKDPAKASGSEDFKVGWSRQNEAPHLAAQQWTILSGRQASGTTSRHIWQRQAAPCSRSLLGSTL